MPDVQLPRVLDARAPREQGLQVAPESVREEGEVGHLLVVDERVAGRDHVVHQEGALCCQRRVDALLEDQPSVDDLVPSQAVLHLVLVRRVPHEDLVTWLNPAGESRRRAFHGDQVGWRQRQHAAGLCRQLDELSPLLQGAVQERDHLAVYHLAARVQGGDPLAKLHLVQPLRCAMLRSHQAPAWETAP